jgi:ferric-dicitrate binding protein FerR (iron transport regulator)
VENVVNDMDDLIGKVLAGEATSEEQEQVLLWRNQSDENETYFQQLSVIFSRAATAVVQVEFDTDAAWNRVKHQLHKNDNKVIPITKTPYFSPLRIAASIFLVMAISVVIYLKTAPPVQTLAVQSEFTTREDTLPDGSTAFLNKKTELNFEYNPREKTRKVKLKGEAYFSVKHEAEKPFIIEADEILVRDIGTEFNLKAYPDKDTIEIVVTHGEVQFYTQHDPGLNLKAGEKAIYSKRAREFYRIEKPDTNTLAYKTKVFSFNNTELESVVALLNEVYNSKISLASESLYTCRLTANFKEDNPEIIVEVIAETMGLELTKKDDQLILSGKGCGN